MKKYRLHWINRTTEIIQGENIEDALIRKGYGAYTAMDIYYYDEL